MPRLLSSALSLRRDPRMLKLPPYLSFLCIAVGITWLLLLPFEKHSRQTYISENALLPGQVHTYFGGSEQNVFRAYRQEMDALASKNNHNINDRLETILEDVGIKVGRQNYTYRAAGRDYSGENVYGILQAPRGDATEAIVLVAAWRSIQGKLNQNGVALALTLVRYFKRWSLWSKDIILVVPPDSRTGTQAWVDAYHDAHNSDYVSSLPLKSGALQGAIAIDYAGWQRFEGIHIIYDGTNGQLPNLDLINSIINIAGGQMGMHTAIQNMKHHKGCYSDRLKTMLRGMLHQGLGIAAGPHSSFIPYHVDAVSLQPYGDGWHDEMAMGKVVEGSFRSLNNLLEHLHQSFFFYLLIRRDRFVSIGTYLPSAMLLSANFTIMAIFLWVKSGQDTLNASESRPSNTKRTKDEAPIRSPPPAAERKLLLPLGIVAACQAVSIVPLFVFNKLPSRMLSSAFTVFLLASAALPLLISYLIATFSKPTAQLFHLTKSLSLLILGMSLATLATLNFSLAFMVGLLACPLTFVQPASSAASRYCLVGLLGAVAPPVVVLAAAHLHNVPVAHLLHEASFGWNVWGMHTAVVIWCLWWPAWLVGMANVLGVSIST